MRKQRVFYFLTLLFSFSFLTVDSGFGTKAFRTSVKERYEFEKVKEGKKLRPWEKISPGLKAILHRKEKVAPVEIRQIGAGKKELEKRKEELKVTSEEEKAAFIRKRPLPLTPPEKEAKEAAAEAKGLVGEVAKEVAPPPKKIVLASQRAKKLGDEADQLEKKLAVLEAQNILKTIRKDITKAQKEFSVASANRGLTRRKLREAKAELKKAEEGPYSYAALEEFKKAVSDAEKESEVVERRIKEVDEEQRTLMREGRDVEDKLSAALKAAGLKKVSGDLKKLTVQAKNLRNEEAKQLVKAADAEQDMFRYVSLRKSLSDSRSKLTENNTRLNEITLELDGWKKEREEADANVLKASEELGDWAKKLDTAKTEEEIAGIRKQIAAMTEEQDIEASRANKASAEVKRLQEEKEFVIKELETYEKILEDGGEQERGFEKEIIEKFEESGITDKAKIRSIFKIREEVLSRELL